MRPLTFFWIGLLVGIGYLGTSFYTHTALLEQTGEKVAEQLAQKQPEPNKRIQEVAQPQTSQKTPPPQVISPLSGEIQALLDQLSGLDSSFQTLRESMNGATTRLVKLGKQYNLTFLDYQKNDVEHPHLSIFSSTLSLGGRFEHILDYLEALHERNLALPLIKIEVLASLEDNTQVRLTFEYPNSLAPIINTAQKQLSEPLK